MNRREFLRSTAAGATGLLAGAWGARAAQPPARKRPNILFCIADDWGWPHAGAYGDPVVKTPAFDRVAAEGILFRYAYVTSPSCTPSRNALLTGQYHWRLGPGASLWSTLDPTTPTWPLLLQKAGYHVGSWRKSWGPGSLKGWKDHPAGKVYRRGLEEFLAARPKGAPFCFFLGAFDPHRGYAPGSGARSGIDPSKIRLFGCFPDSPVVRSDVADYYFEVQRFDRDVAAALKKLEEIGELDNTLVVVTGDNGMPFPRCKSNLYDSGVHVPLAARWGAKLANPGRSIEDFVSLADLAPTFLEAAGLRPPDCMTGRSLMNILTSGKAGLVEPQARSFVLVGKERHVPGQEGHLGGYPCRAIRTHRWLYIRNFQPDRWPAGTPDYRKAAIPGAWLADCDNSPTKTYMWENRQKDDHHRRLYELAFGRRPAEELYDCRKDPDQLNNLAGDPAFAKVKAELAGKLLAELKATGDPRATGGGEQFDTYPYLGGAPKYPGYRRPKKQQP